MISIMVLERPVACPQCGEETLRLVQTGGGKEITLRRCPACYGAAARSRAASIEAIWQACR